MDFKTIFIIPKTVNIMDFTLSEDLRMLKELAREFTNSEIKPVAQKIDEEEKIPKELIQKLAEVGFFGTSFPEEFGGGGFGKVGYCVMMEEIARGCSSTATMIGASINRNKCHLYWWFGRVKEKIFTKTLFRGNDSFLCIN
ncbi:MAG: acyl-CoA dehydrogenase family protein [Ignavibacteriaceae bacterium]|nr:acyl-CoA dehydrogenase family protein [Ignavibacteriaceae bacterium]